MSTLSTTALGLALPSEYGYVVTVTAATFFLGLWHGFRVSMARQPAGIKYPKAHADTADMSSATPEQKQAMHIFNCAQRAHGNFLENHPGVAIAMLISGLKWPVVTAGLGATWIVGRIVYQIGYTSKTAENGKGRLPGYILGAIPQLALYVMAAWTGVSMVR